MDEEVNIPDANLDKTLAFQTDHAWILQIILSIKKKQANNIHPQSKTQTSPTKIPT